MKKVLITALSLVMVGSVLLSAAGPKGPNGPKGPKYVQIFGVITSIDEAGGVYTLTIDDQVLDVLVTGDTVVMECTIPVTPADLAVDDIVKVRWVSGELVADKINILCELPELGL
ncbi:MAG: hypothetical protein WBC05_17355 [Sedimentisphaerales bacterium]